jgi:phosphatidylinositol-3-phosphatase
LTTTATKAARGRVRTTLAALTGLPLSLPACTSANLVPGPAAADPTLAAEPTGSSTSEPTPSPTAAAEPSGTPRSKSSPSPTAAAGVDKLLVIVAENKRVADVSAHMPFLKSHSRRYGTATKYYAITYPSLPNYLVMAGGSTFGVKDNAT